MEVRHDEQPEVLHEKVRVENAKEIRGGDELRNINSYEYLLRIFQALENVVRDTLHQDPRSISLPKEFFPLDRIYELFKDYSDYNPGYAYGDLYTRFILDLEDNLGEIKDYVNSERIRLEQDNELQRARVINFTSNIAQSEGLVKKLNEDGKRLAEEALRENAARAEFLEAIRRTGIKTIYANPNKGLERAGKMVEDIVEETLHTSQEIEETITKRMKRGSGILTRDLNKTTPQYEGSGIARFSAMMSSTYKPQSTTSMASIRTYDYKLDVNGDHRTDIPMEYRFGTQGQYHDKQARVSPLFEDFLEVQQLEREANPPLGPSTRITHIYFNNLGYDRDDMEGKRESRLSMKLHDLEKRHPNVAVITLPADKGMMDKHLLEDHHQSIRIQDAIDDILAIANGTSPRDIKDFHISDDIKQLLYGTDEYSEHGYNTVTENTVLIDLLEETFKKLGVDPDTRATISPAEMQAIYFHFVKYELTNYIIETLKPASFNMSCKDAIDRGGVSSAYYNLMKSLEEGTPISKEEFHRALHAAPTLVKGRGMNHHTKLIWNAVDMYLNGLDKKGVQPEPWMAEWRDKHAPNHTKVRILKDLDDYIGKRDTDQRDKFGMFAKFDKGIKLSAARKLRDLVANPDNNDIEFTPKEWGALNDKRLSKILSEMLKTGFVTKEQIHVQGQEKLSHSM